MAKLKGLGRGLDALLSGNDSRGANDTLQRTCRRHAAARAGSSRARAWIPQSIAELADSIKCAGPDPADPGAPGRTAASTRSSPANGAGGRRSLPG